MVMLEQPFVYAGLRVVFTTAVPFEHVGWEFAAVPWSPHRSRRVWKKRRYGTRRRPLRVPIMAPRTVMVGDTLYAHPSVKAEIEARFVRMAAHELDRQMPAAAPGEALTFEKLKAIARFVKERDTRPIVDFFGVG